MPRFSGSTTLPALALSLTAAATLAPGLAHGLTVNEVSFGDFTTANDVTLATDDIGTLQLGLNAVSGSLSDNCVPSGTDIICIDNGDHSDIFRLSVAPSQRIVSVALTTLGTAPSGYQPGFGMVDLATLGFVHTDSLTDFNATRPIIDGVPIGAGSYGFGVGQGLADVAGQMSYDWTLTFAVAPVPLPAGMLLSLTAIAALAAASRRRRPAAA